MTAPPSTRSGARRWRLVRAHPDAVPDSARRFMQRARQRRMRTAMPWAVIAAVAVLAGAGAWVVYDTSLFGVREIRVTGTSIVTADAVRETAAVPDGKPLAGVDVSAVERRVGSLIPVDHARVHRDWPHTVVVEVTERTAVAVVQQGKKLVLVDHTGVAFTTVAARPSGLPTVKVSKSLPDTQAAVQVLGALTGQLRGELTSITVDGPARITLTLKGGRRIVWGDASQSALKAKVATALLAREDGTTYDVSAPDVVTIR